MQKKKLIWGISCLLGASLPLLACSSVPTERVEQAEQSRARAVEELAPQLASSEWDDAEEAWRAAQDLIAKERYGQARTWLLKARSRYDKARKVAGGKRTQLVREISGIQETARVRCRNLDGWIEAGSRELAAREKEALERQCKEVHETLAEISAQLERGLFEEAKILSQQTLRKVWEMEQEFRSYVGEPERSS